MLPPTNKTLYNPNHMPEQANPIRKETFYRQVRSGNDDSIPPDEKLVREAEKRLRELDEADEKGRRQA